MEEKVEAGKETNARLKDCDGVELALGDKVVFDGEVVGCDNWMVEIKSKCGKLSWLGADCVKKITPSPDSPVKHTYNLLFNMKLDKDCQKLQSAIELTKEVSDRLEIAWRAAGTQDENFLQAYLGDLMQDVGEVLKTLKDLKTIDDVGVEPKTVEEIIEGGKKEGEKKSDGEPTHPLDSLADRRAALRCPQAAKNFNLQ